MLKFGSKHDSNIVYKCTVRLLEDTEILECEYKPHHKGKYLLEYVCQQMNLVEQDYLGLRYVDIQDQRHWLDLGKSICKQVKDLDPVLFSFRVKFYPPDPFRLKEEITRYQIFLQLKRDLLHGRLYCATNEAAMLAALVLQGELGDYDPEIHVGHYVSDFKILLKQTDTIEEKAMEIHQKQLKGQSPSQVENTFLKLACQLDTYGVDPHPVKDHKGSQLYLGINYAGILTIQGSKKTHHFRWPDIQKINYEGKMFIIHLNHNDKKHTVGFKCPTGAACRHVWRCAIEQMLFFTLPASSDAPTVTGGGFFSWGTKFKYTTGRTEKEILEDSGSLTREEPSIQRTSSLRRKASSVPATPSTPLQPHLGYSSLPRSSHSDAGGSRMESSSSTGLLSGLDVNPSQAYSDVAALETVSEDQEAMGASKLRTTVFKDDSMDRFSDYYFRDSFEHSSSESQLIVIAVMTLRIPLIAPVVVDLTIKLTEVCENTVVLIMSSYSVLEVYNMRVVCYVEEIRGASHSGANYSRSIPQIIVTAPDGTVRTERSDKSRRAPTLLTPSSSVKRKRSRSKVLRASRMIHRKSLIPTALNQRIIL